MGRKPGSSNKNAGGDARASGGKRPIESYEHTDKERVNNPPVGLVTPETDLDVGQKKKIYAYDTHLDPQLQWAGKAEHTSFEIPTVSLHVHERIDPRTIIEAVRKRNGDSGAKQGWLFDMTQENPPLREAIEFYQHAHGWSNRMVAGDSLLVMNSLLEKEGMAGKVQMVYLDPPYGIESGGAHQIAVWLLDTDYDGRSLYPRQVFFPQAGESEGWARLAKDLKAEIDEELIEAYRGSVSLPFAAGKHKRIAVKIVDDRGIESLKVMEVEE